jgi:hypothetical protein
MRWSHASFTKGGPAGGIVAALTDGIEVVPGGKREIRGKVVAVLRSVAVGQRRSGEQVNPLG